MCVSVSTSIENEITNSVETTTKLPYLHLATRWNSRRKLVLSRSVQPNNSRKSLKEAGERNISEVCTVSLCFYIQYREVLRCKNALEPPQSFWYKHSHTTTRERESFYLSLACDAESGLLSKAYVLTDVFQCLIRKHKSKKCSHD